MDKHLIGVLKRRSVLLAALIVVFGGASHSVAQQSGLQSRISKVQWKNTYHFSESVTSVEFLDQFGAPNLGFVGTGALWNGPGNLYRTTDRGVTWTKILTKIGGYVSSICFKDTLVGWIATHGNSGCCYETLDGGLTWKPLIKITILAQVYYHPGKHLLFLSSWYTDSSLRSTDDGQTWSLLPSPASQTNGFAFANDTDGMCATVGGNFLLTHDGGFTWNPISFFAECWQPAAIGTGSTFIVGSEGSDNFYRSDDVGQSWKLVSSPIHRTNYHGLTGCAVATPCALFTQTVNGIYISVDSANTWFPLHGPGNSADTRFFATGLEVIAGDTSGFLWRTDLYGSEKTYTIAARGCDTATLSIPVDSLWSPGKVRVQITTDTAGVFRLAGSDTVGSTTIDTILIRFHAGDLATHTARITVFPLDNPTCLVSEAYITARTADAPLLATINSVRVGCSSQIAQLYINNRNCDTLKITSATVSSNLISILKLDTLLSGEDSIGLQISTLALSSSRTYSIRLRGYYSPANIPFDTTIFIPVVNEHPSSTLFSNTQQVSLASMAQCDAIDTTIILTNSGCDTIRVSLAQMNISPEWTLSPSSDTVILLPYQSDTIHIHFTSTKPGIYAQRLSYPYIGPHSDVAVVDLSVTVMPILPSVILSNNFLDLGIRSLCQNDTTLELTFTNSGCDSVLFSNAKLNAVGPFLLQNPGDTILPPNGTGGKSIVYHPSKLGAQSQVLTLHISRTDGTLGHDTTITISGTGILGRVALALPATSLALPQVIAGCSSAMDTVWLFDSTCKALNIDSTRVEGASPLPIVISSIIDYPLPTDSSIGIVVSLYPTSADTGAGTSIIRVFYHGEDAVVHDTTVTVSASAVPPAKVQFHLGEGTAGGALHAGVGGLVKIPIYVRTPSPLSAITSADITSLDVRVWFNTDLLTPLSLSVLGQLYDVDVPSGGRTPLQYQLDGAFLHLPLPSGFTMSGDSLVATLTCQTFVTDTMQTRIWLDPVSISAQANDASCLGVTSDTSSVVFTLDPVCPDNMLSGFVGTHTFQIESIVPNPARDEIVVVVSGVGYGVSGGMEIGIYDVLGNQVHRQAAIASNIGGAFSLDVSDLSDGSYYLRISSGGFVVTGQFVIRR